MAELDELTEDINNLVNSIKNNVDEETNPIEEPVIEIPEKKWYQFGDWFTRQDELLQAILKALLALKAPEVPTPEAPGPTFPPPIIPSPVPVFPPEIPEKLDSLISEQAQTKTLLEGFGFKTGQAYVFSAGTGQQLVHQFRTYIVVIRANDTNTGNIYIGWKDVSANQGFILAPGEGLAIQIDALKKGIYFDADVSGDGVSWMALV